MVYDYVPTQIEKPAKSKVATLLSAIPSAPVLSDDPITKAQEVCNALSDILNTKVDATNLGAPNQEVTVLQAIHLSLAQKAMQGSIAASKLLLEWYAYGIAQPTNTDNATSQTNTQVNIYNELDLTTRRMLEAIGVELPS